MAQILDPLPQGEDKILCCYVNSTSQIQIARISNIPNWYFERVVFPGQRLVFEALSSAMLEIHSGMMASAILSDTIPCTRLLVQEQGRKSGDSSTTQTRAQERGGSNYQTETTRENNLLHHQATARV
ncbi:DUF1830 domain-containing protein [Myxosarcina sp. GI1(2024)]